MNCDRPPHGQEDLSVKVGDCSWKSLHTGHTFWCPPPSVVACLSHWRHPHKAKLFQTLLSMTKLWLACSAILSVLTPPVLRSANCFCGLVTCDTFLLTQLHRKPDPLKLIGSCTLMSKLHHECHCPVAKLASWVGCHDTELRLENMHNMHFGLEAVKSMC